jgi:hypothetical protein
MTIIGALPFLLQNGTTADATQVDADFDAIVTDVNVNAAHNGTNTDITSLAGLTTPLTLLQGGSTTFIAESVSTGTANAQIVAAPVPNGFILSIGFRVIFQPGFANTDNITLNVAGLGATACRKPSPSGLVPLTGGELQVNTIAAFVFDGIQYFVLETDTSQYGGYGPVTALTSATTTDLGTVSSHNVLIGGTTTIASFGSSASTVYPIYFLVFNAVLTLTPSSALLLPGTSAIQTASGDSTFALYRGSGNWTLFNYQKFSGAPIATVSPTTQVFTSGSGTYTPTANVRYIAVRLVGGGGGGGGGQNATPATTGGNTTFGTFTASGGVGGALGSAGTGGAASGGYSNSPGSSGGPPTPPGTAYNAWGGAGGSSQLGGGGAPSISNATASAGATNTGSGGGGGGASNGTLTGSGGAGGGSGGCVIGFLTATTYSYAVGAGGAGAAGASSASSSGGAGGAGAAGKIEVIEYY